LRPGGAFGGSCLPKDVRALQHMSREVNAETWLIDSLLNSNEAHKKHLFEYCTHGLAFGAKVLMLGLAFKADSDDLRESPNVDLARRLLGWGFNLSIYDPSLDPGTLLGRNLAYASSHLPNLAGLLVTHEVVAAGGFDRVIDCSGRRGDLELNGMAIVDIHRLT